jgi:hypothetical protein
MQPINQFLGFVPLLMFLFIPLGALYMLYRIHQNLVGIRRALERIAAPHEVTAD